MARRHCAWTATDGQPCRAPAKKGSEYCRHHPPARKGCQHDPPTSREVCHDVNLEEEFSPERLARLLHPDTTLIVEGHPQLGLYIQAVHYLPPHAGELRLRADSSGLAVATDPPMRLEKTMVREAVLGSRVSGWFTSEGFRQPASLLFTALAHGKQPIYARGERRQKAFRNAIESAVLQLDANRTVYGPDLLDRVRWGEEPPVPPLFDPERTYDQLITVPSEAPSKLLTPADPDGLAELPVRIDPIAHAPNGLPQQVLGRALARRDTWQTNEHEGHKHYSESAATVVYRPWNPAETFGERWWSVAQEKVLTALDHRFRSIRSDLVADVIDIAYLHWLNHGRPAKVGISLAQICEYRGVEVTQSTLEDHWHALRDARCLRVSTADFDAAVLEMDAMRVPHQTRLWDREAWNLEDPPGAQVLCVYSPGAFVGAALSETAGYLAAYSPRLLALDPYRDTMAKRLGRYLRSEWRMNAEGYVPARTPRYRTWGEHLNDAGVSPSERARRSPGDFIAAIERDVAKLCDAGCLAPPARGERLLDWLTHPADRLPLPRTGVLGEFLSRRAHIPPPPEIAADLAGYAQRRLARREQLAALKSGPRRRR